jgi:hypothetical protein
MSVDAARSNKHRVLGFDANGAQILHGRHGRTSGCETNKEGP